MHERTPSHVDLASSEWCCSTPHFHAKLELLVQAPRGTPAMPLNVPPGEPCMHYSFRVSLQRMPRARPSCCKSMRDCGDNVSSLLTCRRCLDAPVRKPPSWVPSLSLSRLSHHGSVRCCAVPGPVSSASPIQIRGPSLAYTVVCLRRPMFCAAFQPWLHIGPLLRSAMGVPPVPFAISTSLSAEAGPVAALLLVASVSAQCPGSRSSRSAFAKENAVPATRLGPRMLQEGSKRAWVH